MKYIDISEHQGRIDWEKVEADGVMIRAGYGRNNIDKQFLRNISECNRLGIPCGVYWFSYAYTPSMALQEAEYCLAAIKPYRVELPVAFDWEYDSDAYAKKNGITPDAELASQMARAFCGRIEVAGYYAMLYANPDYLSRFFQKVWEYDIWLADWGVKQPHVSCGIWQWGGSAVPGIPGEVDTNEAYRDYPAIIAGAGLNHLTDKLWYAAAQDWAVQNGISDGTRPEEAATRAEVWQMLKNMEGRK